jgi:hypothetical protein
MLVTPRSQPRMAAFGLALRMVLSRWKDGQITIFRKAGGLPDDALPSLFRDGRGRIRGFTGQGLPISRTLVATVPGGQVHFITGDTAVA